jgi:hypothetical protein
MELKEAIDKVRVLQNAYDRLVNVLCILEGKQEYPLGRSGVFSASDIETCEEYIRKTKSDIKDTLLKIKVKAAYL